MGSLRAKVFVLVTLLVVITQVATITTVLYTAHRDVAAQAHETLDTGGGVLRQVMDGRAKQLRDTVELLVSDFGFKRAVATGDMATISSALSNHGGRIDADIAILLNEAGEVTATSRALRGGELAFPDFVRHAKATGFARSALIVDGQMYEMMTVPVRAPLPIAWVVMGFEVGDTLALRLASLLRLDVTFRQEGVGAARLFGTSLSSQDAGIEPTEMSRLALEQGPVLAVDRLGREQVILRQPFIDDASGVYVYLQKSLHDAMAPYRLLRVGILLLSGIALLLALGGAVWLSRHISNPMRALATAARRIIDGDYREQVETDAQDEIGELAKVFNVMQVSIAEREQRISYHAHFDALTGLPNRFHLLELLPGLIERAGLLDRPVTIMEVELGGVAQITSSLGQDLADMLLVHVTERLQASLDSRYLLARLEGARFLVILSDADMGVAIELAEDLWHLLDEGFSVRDVNVTLDAVFGVCSAPQHGTDPERLLVRASVAKNNAQASHQRCGVYEDGLEESYVRRITLLGHLRRAAKHNELRLHMQPKYDLGSGRVIGAEALVRWQHPEFGWLMPDEFIPAAEQAGNISIVTNWALAAAIRECRAWSDVGRDLSVSVNLSGRDLLNQKLPFYVNELLRASRVDPRNLVLEVTEEMFVRDLDRAASLLQMLRDFGVRVAIDDFGTGYSSLSQLKHLPIDELKIDKSFVLQLPSQAEDAAIVSATIQMAQTLGLTSVAEGVESEAALHWLAGRGCQIAQGYFIARPMPANEFCGWLLEFEARRSGSERASASRPQPA